jgi:adenylate cyclase
MAIFYVSEYTELAHQMEPWQALREASLNRLRPIAMTTLAAILTLSPLALAIGQGSQMQQPLAIAIISGLLLQFPLVLLVMPVLIGLTNTKRHHEDHPGADEAQTETPRSEDEMSLTLPADERSPALPPFQRVVRDFLFEAEIRAERSIALFRFATAAFLTAVVYLGGETQEAVTGAAGTRSDRPPLSAIGFVIVALVALATIRAGRYRPGLGWLFASLDVGLALVALAAGAHEYHLSGNYLFILPSAWIGVLVLVFNVLRYRALIVGALTSVYIGGVIIIALTTGFALAGIQAPPQAARFADLPANLVRLSLVLFAGFGLTFVARHGRQLLLNALAEARGRQLLTRFLPPTVAADLLREGSPLSKGATLDCAIIFVDLRDSTGLVEKMPPDQVADFLTRFRRRITSAAKAHQGVIEKFIGDGAMIVFGVPTPQPDDARRAIACGLDLVRAIEQWNENRNIDSRLAIVVGIHAGPCFCGVVGDQSRLEFTVIGDTVNVAARLEVLAKARNQTILASRNVLDRAEMLGENANWRSLGDQPLRGRDEPVEVFAVH